MHGSQEGGPYQAAKRIIEVVTRTGMGANNTKGLCLRLPSGKDALKHFGGNDNTAVSEQPETVAPPNLTGCSTPDCISTICLNILPCAHRQENSWSDANCCKQLES